MPRFCRHIVVITVLATLASAAEAAPRRKRNRGAPGKAMNVVASETSVKHLDERTTTAEITVRKRPGERQAAAGTLAAGTKVVVVAEQGRWLRVRAGKITGYVTRTTVSAPRVAADASDAPRATSSADDDPLAFRTHPPMSPAIDPEVPRPTRWRTARAREIAKTWSQVRDDGGHTGWLAGRELGNEPSDRAVGTEAPVRPLAAATATSAASPAADREHRQSWSLHLAAAAGYRALATQIESRGDEQHFSGSASVARLEVDAAAYPLRTISVGVDAHLDLGRSAVTLDGAGRRQATRGLSAGVRLGIRPRELAQLSLRAGTRREAARVVQDTAAAEQLAGTTLGVRVDVSPRRSRISARLEIDTLVAGTWQHGDAGMQTPARAMWAGMTVGVRMVGGVSLLGGFELGRASTAWTDMTMPEPAGGRRIEESQTLHIGLSGAL